MPGTSLVLKASYTFPTVGKHLDCPYFDIFSEGTFSGRGSVFHAWGN